MIRGVLLGALLLALIGLLYTLQRSNDVAITPAPEPNALPRYTLTNAVLTRYDTDGRPALRGHAQTLDYYDDESAHAENLQLDLLSTARAPWRATAPSGMLPAHSHRFLLEGNVVAEGRWPDNNEALTIRTEQLWVDPDQHSLQTDRPVTLTGATRDGSAVGVKANWVEQNMELLNDVKMHYEAKR